MPFRHPTSWWNTLCNFELWNLINQWTDRVILQNWKEWATILAWMMRWVACTTTRLLYPSLDRDYVITILNMSKEKNIVVGKPVL